MSLGEIASTLSIVWASMVAGNHLYQVMQKNPDWWVAWERSLHQFTALLCALFAFYLRRTP